MVKYKQLKWKLQADIAENGRIIWYDIDFLIKAAHSKRSIVRFPVFPFFFFKSFSKPNMMLNFFSSSWCLNIVVWTIQNDCGGKYFSLVFLHLLSQDNIKDRGGVFIGCFRITFCLYYILGKVSFHAIHFWKYDLLSVPFVRTCFGLIKEIWYNQLCVYLWI